MCNWSEAIFERAIEEGLKKGIEDLHRITKNRPYRDKLLQEFGIE